MKRPVRICPFEDEFDVPFADDALFLILNTDLVQVVLRSIAAGCRNIGVLHMGDEFYDSDRSYYPLVDYVLRNYYRADVLELPPNARCREIRWIPNGYRSGVGPQNVLELLPYPRRDHLLAFAGCLTTGGGGLKERAEMIDAVQSANKPGVIVTSSGFGGGLSPSEYAALLQNSRFALVPGGRNPETIRLYDALETGAIPISLRHEFLGNSGPMADAPFVFLDSWRELPGWLTLNATADCDARNIERQRQCLEWWSSYKDFHRVRVTSLIDASFAAFALAGSFASSNACGQRLRSDRTQTVALKANERS